jgi:DNA-binding IclR family transcriptional regulator
MADRPKWTFITSHGSILLEVAREPNATVREIAAGAGVTERQAHRVLADLAEEGYIIRERVGRRNRYRVQGRKPLRLAAIADRQVGELLAALKPR